MEKERQSFLFHFSFWDSIEELEDSTQLQFLRAIIKYARYGIEPQWKTKLECSVWKLMQSALKSDLAVYEAKCAKNSEAGKKHKGNQHTRKKEAENTQTNGTNVPKMEQAFQNRNERSKIGTENITEQNITEQNITEQKNNDDDEEDPTKKIVVNIDNFVKVWNDVGSKKIIRDPEFKTLKCINTDECHHIGVDLPTDAQQRLNTLCDNVAKLIKERGASEIAKTIHKDLPTDFDYNNSKHFNPLIANVIAVVIEKLVNVKMKPKATNFGSFQWFTDFKNFKKLLDGEIQ